MPDRNYMSHISGNCFVKRCDLQSIKEGLLRSIGNMYDAFKHYNKYEHKCKK